MSQSGVRLHDPVRIDRTGVEGRIIAIDRFLFVVSAITRNIHAMGSKTKIEWTAGGATWTPIRARNRATGRIGWHCEHSTPGCEHCYAEGINKRLGTGLAFKPGHRDDIELFLDEKMLLAPLRWTKPRMIFTGSMTDLFADFVPDEWIDRVFAVMALAPQHVYQILTKRSARMRTYMTDADAYRRILHASEPLRAADGRLCGIPISNPMDAWPQLWLGVSAEDQRRADERVPDLLATPAVVRFVSAEPLLGPITFWAGDEDAGAWRGCGVKESGGVTVGSPDNPPEGYDDSQPWLDWIIVGAESGHGARPMEQQWAQGIVDQCAAASVACFVKQLSGPNGRALKDMIAFPPHLRVREYPSAA